MEIFSAITYRLEWKLVGAAHPTSYIEGGAGDDDIEGGDGNDTVAEILCYL